MPEQTYLRLTDDRHQQALYRLSAVQQYLYDTMGGDDESNPANRPGGPPMPDLPMELVREAQRQIARAIREGQRTRRSCLGGELVLVEQRGPQTVPVVQEGGEGA